MPEMIGPELKTLLARVLTDCTAVVLGPILWSESDASPDGRVHWFTIACGQPQTANYRMSRFEFSTDKTDRDLLAVRSTVKAEIAGMGPRAIFDTDDELVFAKWCEAIWPCDRSRTLRRAVEAERAPLQ
jgi:hypothetical protein